MHFGVQLFFIISGFVITKTLEGTIKYKDFLVKRAIRIFVSLLVVVPSLFFLGNLFPSSSLHQNLTLSNLVISLLVIPPTLINSFLSSNLSWVTGVLATLSQELFFYVVAGFFYFYVSKKFFLLIVSFLTFSFYFSMHLDFLSNFQWYSIYQENARSFGLGLWLYFLFGAYLYNIKTKKVTLKYWHLSFLVLFGIFQMYIDLDNRKEMYLISYYIIILLFIFIASYTAVFFSDKKIWRFKPALYLGNISYEFYLIHEFFGLTVLNYFSDPIGLLNYLVITFLIFIVTVILSGITFKYWFTPLNRFLRDRLVIRGG